jgi:non-ribosomal peptide synthase protein (TIGR01720 family)
MGGAAAVGEIWREVLGLAELEADQNFFDIGGDSLLGLRVVASARAAGYPMRPRHIFLGQTVSGLAALLVSELADTGAVTGAGNSHAADGARGAAPLLPIQSWFLSVPEAAVGHYNYSGMFDVASRLPEAHLNEAIDAALAHHDAFRLRFRRTSTGEWSQTYGTEPPHGVLRRFDFSGMKPARVETAVDRAVRTCQSSISLLDGPLVSFALFSLPGGERRLLVAAHHLIMEPASMNILIDDITTACGQLGRGAAVELLPQRSTYQDWGRALTALAASETVRSEADHWRRVTASAPGILQVDLPDGVNDVASQATLAEPLGEAVTRALRRDVTGATGATLTEIVLAGAAAALRPIVTGGPLRIDFETHGREDVVDSIDLSRTIGWFAALFPLALPEPSAAAREELEAAVRTLRAVPQGGLGHGLLTFVTGDLPDQRNRVGVTYLGSNAGGDRDDMLLRFTGFAEHDRAPRMTRPHELEISAMVTEDVLWFSVTYSANRYPESRIRELHGEARAYFERLIAETAETSEGAW